MVRSSLLLIVAAAAATEDVCSTPGGVSYSPPVQVSDQPRIYVIDNFMSPADCEEIFAAFEPKLETSQTMSKDGQQQENPFGRRSRQFTMSPKAWSPLISKLVNAMDATSMQPFANGQHLTVTHYNEGDGYELHVDTSHSVGRVATALIFLREPESGGETVFPWARTSTLRGADDGGEGRQRPPGVHGRGRSIDELLSAKQVPSMEAIGACEDSPENEAVRIEPRVGRLVVFFSHDPQGRTLRPRSLHGSCPVKGGEKAIAQRFYQYYALNGENRLGTLLESLERTHGKSEQTIVWWGKEEP